MIFKFKTDEIDKEVNNWICNCLILNSAIISLGALLIWSLIGSWLYNTDNYWVEIFLLVFATSMIGSYKKILVFNIIMFIISTVFSIAIGFTSVLIPFSIGIFYLNIKAFMGVLNYKKISHYKTTKNI